MELRKKLISVAALAFTVALGAGMATMTASAEEELTGFAITEFSVRVNGKTDDEGNDTSGLRFKTVTPEGKEAYDAYYTVLSIEGKGSKTVWADTWRSTNDGWNTVVMGIPQSDYKTDITATSYVEIDGEVFATDAATLNLSEAASLAINTAKTQKDAIAINKYIWTEGASVSKTYTMSDYTAGTQYAEGEEHVLDEVVTVTTTQCHFTTQLRIYSSSTHNGFAIIQATTPIKGLTVNAKGDKAADTLNVYGSADGETWSSDPVATISVTSTSYNDYSVTLGTGYQYLKLDVAGANQVRVASFGLDLGAGGGYGLGEVPLVLPEDGSELTIEDVLLFPLTETTTQKYSLTAEVKSVSNTTLYLKDDEGNELTAYKCNNYDEVAVKPQPGDTVTVYGALGVYSGKNQMVQPTIEEVIVCDKNKAQAVLDQLTFAEEDLAKLESGTRDITLPIATADYDFDVEWTPGDYVKIEGNKVTITAPEGQSGVAKFSVSVTVGDVTLPNSFTVQVGQSSGEETTIEWVASKQGYSSGEAVSSVLLDGTITMTTAGNGNNNTPKYYITGTAIRIYPKNQLTFTASGTAKIQSVVLTTASGSSYIITSNGTSVDAGTLTYDNTVVTISGLNTTSVTITIHEGATSGHVRLLKVEVTYVG